MRLRPFTSESYSEGDRPEAWRDVLASVGLQPTVATSTHAGHAIAVRRSFQGVTLARLSAGQQSVSPRTDAVADHPLVLLPLEDGVALKTTTGYQIVAARHLLLLPRAGDWSVSFQREMRAVVLSVTSEPAHRHRATLQGGEVRVLQPGGFGRVFAQMMELAARDLDALSDVEWTALARSLADLLPTFMRQHGETAGDRGGGASKAATLHRLCQTVERSLEEPDLTPVKIASAEGISERYLQKLFEGAGTSFTHYLRERRLQRTWADLSNPAEAHRSISEIAFRVGFNDSAHFSRAFRQRFGLSPREFRHHEAERQTASAATVQRGWPQQALAQMCSRRAALVRRTAAPFNAHDVEIADAPRHHHLAADASRVHWGYFSHSLPPQVEIGSGDTITIETLTQHASDDPERMIKGDPGAESVFHWTRDRKNVDRRGAGPLDASIYGRGAGEGFGVHICTGPVAVKDAEPGDVLEIRILDIAPRASRNPDFEGRVFGSSVAAWWGYHYKEFLAEQNAHEAVTIYEIVDDDDAPHARALYSYRWEPQTDPFGTLHKTYDYPGIPIPPSSVRRRHDVLDGIRIPLRPHFGVIALAPREAELVDSVPPAYFGGNLDNWRLGKGSTVYLPVSVPGALLSVGDPHAAQGDGELGGTAIECSMTGTFQVILHKKNELTNQPFADLTYPLIETEADWVLMGFSHPNYLAEFGAKGQSEVYATSSLDLAMKDAFRKMRRFLMNIKGLTEDEAIALMSVAVDFGVTQVVDGNWGVHAILSKRVFDHAPQN
ncbi:acetamidase/formamidase/AraC-like DNA-binding protein [Bradyrhizobium sp. USDA 4532]|uniref:acetamidase/formamidase family protein n=1 Tax=unclassified Bradyrhizobium TaxID=2631580 RepID=UPI0020A161C4|nr:MULTISPECIES: acetamidase/formamidase family protein [unclassified Bradyrhizobium]MCP1837020.1 acetamidase/formamidase/AraC-like DNA-binding protein [Bradyrhizobium sp. USDA 4545]MCP1921768.1 acetamidase/formamidase/AraC-like DNA-binding protein [Bradyrhizobium sp. USDA 4532]